ncbi:MAG: hypothetical protein KTR31_22605 [Myxococcales bacterium]|nr:hypothetical protein [Myxococcales bacterium]
MIRALAPAFVLLACSKTSDLEEPTTTPAEAGVAVLGQNTHALSSVEVREVVVDDLTWPRDLEFHPNADELWVVNRQTDSITIVSDPHGAATTRHASDPSGNHFLAQPSALAFNQRGNFATSHEEHDLTQGNATPVDFMGPTLWDGESSNFDGGHDSHLDMLHNSPDGAGIAWERQNVFWVFDGWNASLTRYDFVDDHGRGGSDHTDAIIQRFAEGRVGFVPDVVSHMAYDRDTDMLYVADSGKNRLAVLDASSGTIGGSIGPNYDGCEMRAVDGWDLSKLVDGDDVDGMELPSGLELHDGLLWVTDADTSIIFAFDLDGTLVDYLETGWESGTLGGIAFDDDGDLWVVDQIRDMVLEISPLQD